MTPRTSISICNRDHNYTTVSSHGSVIREYDVTQRLYDVIFDHVTCGKVARPL